MIGASLWIDDADANASQPRVAVVADSATAEALTAARQRLADALTPASERREGRQSRSFPILEIVQPAENVGPQAQRLLADESGSYSAVLSGTLERLTLTGPARIDDSLAQRIGLIVEDARRVAALAAAGRAPVAAPVERVITAQAAGNLQLIRRGIARSVMGLIFGITVLLATLLLSNLAEEKTNKVIEILAAAVPLDSVFLGKLIAMLGISFVGLAVWGGMAGLAYLFVQVVQDFMTLPEAGPAVGWPVFVILVLLYYGANYMLLGRAVPRHRRPGEQHPRDPDAVDAGDDAAGRRLLPRRHRRRPDRRRARLVRLSVAVQLADGDDRAGGGIGDALAAPARLGLAGALGRADHPHLVAPVPPHRAQVRLERRLLQLRPARRAPARRSSSDAI